MVKPGLGTPGRGAPGGREAGAAPRPGMAAAVAAGGAGGHRLPRRARAPSVRIKASSDRERVMYGPFYRARAALWLGHAGRRDERPRRVGRPRGRVGTPGPARDRPI